MLTNLLVSLKHSGSVNLLLNGRSWWCWKPPKSFCQIRTCSLITLGSSELSREQLWVIQVFKKAGKYDTWDYIATSFKGMDIIPCNEHVQDITHLVCICSKCWLLCQAYSVYGIVANNLGNLFLANFLLFKLLLYEFRISRTFPEAILLTLLFCGVFFVVAFLFDWYRRAFMILQFGIST